MSEVFQETKNSVMIGENKDVEILLPRLTLKKILALTEAVDTLVKAAKEKSPQLFEIFTKNQNNDNLSVGVELVKLAPSILPVLLGEISQVLAIYINRDKEWVEDNLDLEDLVAIATPFFGHISKQASHILGPLSNLFPKQQQEETSLLQ